MLNKSMEHITLEGGKKYENRSNSGISGFPGQEGDNLSAIADRFGVPLPALLIWNRLDPTRPIHPGDRLIIAPDQLDPNRKKQ